MERLTALTLAAGAVYGCECGGSEGSTPPTDDIESISSAELDRLMSQHGQIATLARNAVIVGDTLQYRFARKLAPPARWVTRRPDVAKRSLAKLLNLDFDVICFSHFPPLSEEPHKAIRRLIDQHSLRPSST